MEHNVLIAFLLTAAAGLSTGIGSLLALLTKNTNKNFLSVSLGFSAGVMIYVSTIEIFPQAQLSLELVMDKKSAAIVAVLAFFGGIVVTAIIDRVIPSEKNPHELRSMLPVQEGEDAENQSKLMRTGVFTALAIALHNFPEGLATFVSALQEPSIAIPIVVAIAIHNIPEGISVSVPIYYATGSRGKAFLYSFLSGLAEPLGALLGFLILMPFMDGSLFGILFAGVAGVMVFISLDELLPTAQAYGKHHLAIYGLVAGMAVMAFSLLLFL